VIERARSDDDKAFCLIGEKYYHSKDYLKAIIWLLKSAYFNNSGAQYYIGRIFETGINSTNNKQQALEWYQRSADQTNRLAITRMIKLKWKGHFLDSNQKGIF
jgi:TPR repeat protein